LLGEDHEIAQIPLFAAAVAQVQQPAVFVAEVDPYVAQDLVALSARQAPPTAYLQQYPEALCFYNWAEEFELIRSLRAQKTQIWGIDQVYAMTAGRFYTRLAEQVKGPAAKAYALHRAAFYRAQGKALETESATKASMTLQSTEAVDSLLTATRREGPAVQQMVRDYAASHAIYRTYQTRKPLPNGLSGHQARLNLMRHSLL
jgi:hypothetical protein